MHRVESVGWLADVTGGIMLFAVSVKTYVKREEDGPKTANSTSRKY